MKKLLHNRLFLAGICILLTVCGMLYYSSYIKSQNKTTEVVTFTQPVRKGQEIREGDVKLLTVGEYNLSPDFLTATDAVIGKYALTDLYAGDYATGEKLAEQLTNSDERLLTLDGSRLAVSILLKDFSRGVSDKLIAGDIVSCMVTKEEVTGIPPELTYLEVLATTMPDGRDKQRAEDTEEDNLATVTLLATPEQAQLLADQNINAEITLALAYRGSTENAQKFLDMQAENLAKEVQKNADRDNG